MVGYFVMDLFVILHFVMVPREKADKFSVCVGVLLEHGNIFFPFLQYEAWPF
jgi:hypothetical protein